MFQIATAYALAIDNNDHCVFPLHVEGATPNTQERVFYANTILRNITYGYDFRSINKIYRESGFHYKEIQYEKNMVLDGYFQSEKYFSHRRKQILNLFSATSYIENQLDKYADIIHSDDFAAVHVRRGDYVNLSNVHSNLAECSNYYDVALKIFEDKKKVFFSDDIGWCYNRFGSDNIFVHDDENDVVEMFLFSRIRNKIISNSSFSWWGDWLGDENRSRVIAPKTWFGPGNSHLNTEDVIPAQWERA